MRFPFFQRATPPEPKAVAYSQLLGVPLGVNEQALRAAYLKQARHFHPDRNPEGAAKMPLLNEAYQYLLRQCPK
jgi:curved DNA-binding protein CbpA